MLQVARLAPQLLSDSAELVHGFFLKNIDENGGFLDRAGLPDLYYAVFGLEGLTALQATFPKDAVRSWLQGFGNGSELDLIHRCALVRSWCSMGEIPKTVADTVLNGLEAARTSDGGFANDGDKNHGTIYGTFMALGAYQDCGVTIPNEGALVPFVQSLKTEDGGFADRSGIRWGTTPTTAAAITILHQMGEHPGDETRDWILRRFHPQGGFYALDGAALPDLLSTAVALHALVSMGVTLDAFREACLDFIDSLWVNKGAFHGCWADDVLDLEYTFYGLLALGHLYL